MRNTKPRGRSRNEVDRADGVEKTDREINKYINTIKLTNKIGLIIRMTT